MAAGKLQFLTIVLKIVHVIWRDTWKVGVEAEMAYGSDNPLESIGQYLWGNLQAHRVLDGLLQTKFRQNPKVATHITV